MEMALSLSVALLTFHHFACCYPSPVAVTQRTPQPTCERSVALRETNRNKRGWRFVVVGRIFLKISVRVPSPLVGLFSPLLLSLSFLFFFSFLVVESNESGLYFILFFPPPALWNAPSRGGMMATFLQYFVSLLFDEYLPMYTHAHYK